MPFGITKLSLVGIAIWAAGACVGIWRLLFDKTLSGYVVAFVMLFVILLPALLVALRRASKAAAEFCS
jgi:hypothetical protein